MKIIKVVHSQNQRDLIQEREYFTIKNYSIKNFLEKKKFNENIQTLKKEIFGSSKIRATDFMPININLDPSKTFIRHTKIDIFSTYIKVLFNNLLADLIDNLEQIEIISLEEAKRQYPRTTNLAVGAYTLHPRDSLHLTSLEYFHKNLAMEKDDELIVLLGRMGAKSLRIIERDIHSDSGNATTDVNTIKMGIEGNANLSKKIDKSKELIVEFEGKKVDINPNILENSLWFSDDSKMLSILESRKFNQNRIEKYTLINTYTQTFDFDFELAARYIIVDADLKSQYKSVSKGERSFQVEFG